MTAAGIHGGVLFPLWIAPIPHWPSPEWDMMFIPGSLAADHKRTWLDDLIWQQDMA